jgi:hypothetical protein
VLCDRSPSDRLLSQVQRFKRDTLNTLDLKPDTGDIADGVPLTAEATDHDLIVIVNVVEATISGDESGDLLPVLPEEDPDGLPDARVRLLGAHADLLGDQALRLRGAGERRLELLLQQTLLQSD